MSAKVTYTVECHAVPGKPGFWHYKIIRKTPADRRVASVTIDQRRGKRLDIAAYLEMLDHQARGEPWIDPETGHEQPELPF